MWWAGRVRTDKGASVLLDLSVGRWVMTMRRLKVLDDWPDLHGAACWTRAGVSMMMMPDGDGVGDGAGVGTGAQ